MNKEDTLKLIDEYEAHYKYDSKYMREILNHAPEAFEKYYAFIPMAEYRKVTPVEVYYVAKLAAMAEEDCGECLQLNIRFALENDVSREVIRAVIDGEGSLSDDLRTVYNFTVKVANREDIPQELSISMEKKYGKEIMIELALCIASAKVFPTLRRTLGYARSCSLLEFEI